MEAEIATVAQQHPVLVLALSANLAEGQLLGDFDVVLRLRLLDRDLTGDFAVYLPPHQDQVVLLSIYRASVHVLGPLLDALETELVVAGLGRADLLRPERRQADGTFVGLAVARV